ncbi:MAG: helix-turn-helix domain-containing protein [Cyclobacteriaceae bacterium]
MTEVSVLLNYFVLSGVLHGFYLAAILAFTRSGNRIGKSWLMSIVLGAFSLYLFNTWISNERLDNLNAYLSGTSMPFLYLVGPAFWLYLQFVTGNKSKWHKLDVIHLLPMVICFVAASPYYFMDCQVKLQQIALLQNNDANLPYQRGFYFAGQIIQTLIYLYLSFLTVSSFQKSAQRQTKEIRLLKDWTTKTCTFMVVLTTIYIVSFVGFVFFKSGRTFFDTVFDLSITCFIHLIGFWMIKESPVLSSVRSANELTSDFMDDSVKQKILELMRSKPYLDPDYSLKQLSDQLGTNTVYASRMINEYFQQSFTDFINQFRVEEVKQRLGEDSDDKLLAVALESGFSNKHTFNRVFKKHTSLTPSAYRDSVKK